MNANARQGDPNQTGLVLYILYGIGIIVGVVAIAGVIMAYVKRDDTRGTMLESHITYLIRTFWIAFIGGIAGLVLQFVLIGYLVLLAVWIWYIYRVVKGFVAYNDGKPIADPEGWL